MSALLLQCFAAAKAAFPDAVRSVAVSTSANVTVTIDGLQENETIARAMGKATLTDSVDTVVWIPTATIPDVKVLRGRTAVVTRGSAQTTMRIMATEEHALGGLARLQFGDYDRTVA